MKDRAGMQRTNTDQTDQMGLTAANIQAETAMQIKQISKIYKLYDRPIDRLKEALGFSKKKYREHYALHEVSFTVAKGECVGIIGANGAGKSTLLKIITGVLNPTFGSVEIKGRISALLELGAGFNGEYTGRENVYLNGTMNGFTRDEIDARMEGILSFADIGTFIDQPVKTYSSGMFVRLAFAVAINIEPEILIVDEALSVGDVFFQAKCYHKFEQFKKQGKTIVFVSHDLSSINKYCNRVILLDHGTKMAEGNPKEIIDLYKKVLVGQTDPVFQGEKHITSQPAHSTWKEKLQLNPDRNEYGNRKAEIIDFAIIDENGTVTNMIEKGKYFSIKLKVLFYEKISLPIYAFAVKNLLGVTLTGTNTMYEKADTGSKEKDETAEITYTMKMNLQGGEYLLSLGCTGYENGELTVYHRLYDICSISVISDKVTDGYYDLYPSLEIIGGKKGQVS